MISAIYNSFERMFLVSGGILLLFLESLGMIRLRGNDLGRVLRQVLVIGVQTTPLAALIGLFTGMIIALNTGIPMRDFGLEDQLGRIIGVAMVREFAPVFTAFIVAARVGAAMTAELGTMAVNEEVDALRAMGIRPPRYLAMPRILGSLISNPMLTIYSTATGLLGGALVSWSYLRVPFGTYWDAVMMSLDMTEIFNGMTKAVVFGAIYSSVCVWHGLTTTGGAAGVGRSTTRSVVISLTMILLADFVLTRYMYG